MAAPDYQDTAPYPTGRFVNGVFYGERLVECDNDDVAALLEWFDTYPNDLWPTQYPFGGWAGTARCVEAQIRPKPKTKVTSSTKPYIDYDRTWISLLYNTKDMIDVGGYLLWEELKPGLRTISHTRANELLWANDDEPLLDGKVRIRTWATAGTYAISHYKLLASPASLSTVWGKVNSTTYQTASLGYRFDPGVMLCTGARVLRGSPGALTSSWKQAHYEFQIQLDGWNNVFRLDTGQFEEVKLPDGTTLKTQPEAAFTYASLRL